MSANSDILSEIKEWEESNLTQQEFCKKKNISYRSFKTHRAKAMKKGIFKPKPQRRIPQFSPISIIPQPKINEQVISQPIKDNEAKIRIRLPHDIIIEIPANVSSM